MKNKWHSAKLSELEGLLKTDLLNGLSMRESRERLEKEKKQDGGDRRSLFTPKRKSYLKQSLSFFATPGIIILIIISLLAAVFSDLYSGLFVLLITVIGALVGGIILQSAQKRLDSMQEFASPMVRVRRGGNNFYTDGRNLVKGDIIILSKGDLVPCDARLISSDGLVVKELIHTGKGVRNRITEKSYEIIYDENDILSTPDAVNMVYAGSAVISGKANAVVVRCGGEVYLAKYLPDGALGGFEDVDEGINAFKPILHRITFISISVLAILSLLSLVTLNETSFVSNFLMLLSSVAMISLEVFRMGQRNILASRIERMSRCGIQRKKNDTTAHIRGIKTVENLTKVTDLVLLGHAALSDGIYHIGGICSYADEKTSVELSVDDPLANRVLAYMYTYLKALSESSVENNFVLDGVADALSDYIRASGFDTRGAALVIKSLYFANDASGENGYACAETTESTYRVALTFDSDIVDFCKYARAKDAKGRIDISNLIAGLGNFKSEVEEKGGKCLYIVSETGGQAVLEGVLSLFEGSAYELDAALPELLKMGVRTTVMLTEDEYKQADDLDSDLFDGKVAYAKEFKKSDLDITYGIGEYSAYIGFTTQEYEKLVLAMRKRGACVAAYGIDDNYYDVMARVDIAISADLVRYSSQKYRESVYEKLAHEGRDTNIRCSARTRLLSKVLIHRTHSKGGGLLAISNAIRKARGAYISFSQSILLFASLMCTLTAIVGMSAIVGIQLLNSVQTVALAIVGAILSMLAFSDSEPRYDLIYSKTDFSKYSIRIIDGRLLGLFARAGFTAIFAISIKILDAVGVFGDRASYSMPVFVAMLFVAAAEMFFMNMEFTRRGEGRRRSWIGFSVAYAMILSVGAIITQSGFALELYPYGIGTLEFIITPVYSLLYVILISALYLSHNRRNKLNK